MARHATPMEVELGRAALQHSDVVGLGRRWWRLDEAEDVGGVLSVFSPIDDEGEFWYDVGSIRLKVGDDLGEVRERVRTFLRSLPRLPRAR